MFRVGEPKLTSEFGLLMGKVADLQSVFFGISYLLKCSF